MPAFGKSPIYTACEEESVVNVLMDVGFVKQRLTVIYELFPFIPQGAFKVVNGVKSRLATLLVRRWPFFCSHGPHAHLCFWDVLTLLDGRLFLP